MNAARRSAIPVRTASDMNTSTPNPAKIKKRGQRARSARLRRLADGRIEIEDLVERAERQEQPDQHRRDAPINKMPSKMRLLLLWPRAARGPAPARSL